MTKQSDSWQTPKWLFDELDEEFHFDADLCCTLTNSKCDISVTEYFEYEPPTGSVNFMNPPYSNPKPFIKKAWEDSKYCKIVCLVKCDPSTQWWATFWDYGTRGASGNLLRYGAKPGCEVRFFPKRIKFDPPEGHIGKVTSSAFPCALLIFDRRERDKMIETDKHRKVVINKINMLKLSISFPALAKSETIDVVRVAQILELITRLEEEVTKFDKQKGK